MKRLENSHHVIYDAQLIIYYCFLFKNHRIIELTNKSRLLTQFLINHEIQIVVPESIINEIKKKGFGKIISEYTSSKYPMQIIGLPKNLSPTFEYRMKKKIEDNFYKMINKNWFEIKEYSPNESFIDQIKGFYINFKDIEMLNEFLTIKRRESPIPSEVDLELIAFSKDMDFPIISNDNDITFFAEELYENGFSSKIYNFRDLDFYYN